MPMNMHIETASKTGLLWFGNTLVSIKVPSSSGADGICVMEQWMPYGDAPPFHVHHREDEIFHLIEGEMRFRVGEHELVARRGDTVLAPKGIPHGYRVESHDGVHVLTITKGTDFEAMVRAMSRAADYPGLPPATEPSPEIVERLTACCALNHIELMGPPLAPA
jgi:quercetin dioxygenase-like cupin family protein